MQLVTGFEVSSRKRQLDAEESWEAFQALDGEVLARRINTSPPRPPQGFLRQSEHPLQDMIGIFTPEFLNKKHLHFGQGLEFLKFGQGNRGLNQQIRRKSKETLRTNEGKRGKSDKKIRVRDPYFLFDNFLFNLFSVVVSIQFLITLPCTCGIYEGLRKYPS